MTITAEFRPVTQLADEFASGLASDVMPLMPRGEEISEDSSSPKPESRHFGPMWINEHQQAPFALQDEATGLNLALDQEYDGIHLGKLPADNRVAARTIMESLTAIGDHYAVSDRDPDTIVGAITYGRMGRAAMKAGFAMTELPVPSNESKDADRKAVIIHTTIGQLIARHATKTKP